MGVVVMVVAVAVASLRPFWCGSARYGAIEGVNLRCRVRRRIARERICRSASRRRWMIDSHCVHQVAFGDFGDSACDRDVTLERVSRLGLEQSIASS